MTGYNSNWIEERHRSTSPSASTECRDYRKGSVDRIDDRREPKKSGEQPKVEKFQKGLDER